MSVTHNNLLNPFLTEHCVHCASFFARRLGRNLVKLVSVSGTVTNSYVCPPGEQASTSSHWPAHAVTLGYIDLCCRQTFTGGLTMY